MEICGLDHAALFVRDVERSRHFYGQVLGMDEVPRPSNFTFPGAWFRKSGAEIHLIGTDSPEPQEEPNDAHDPEAIALGHVTHIAFEVADLEAAQAHLQKHDVPVLGGPRPRGDGVEQLYVADPDGYIVELFTWKPVDNGGSRKAL